MKVTHKCMINIVKFYTLEYFKWMVRIFLKVVSNNEKSSLSINALT